MKTLLLSAALALLGMASAQTPKIKVVDCVKQASAAECQRPTSANAATVGDGVPFYGGGFGDEIVGGFVRGNTGILAVKLADAGIVVSVDLATGNRTLVSGKLDDNTARGKSALYKASPTSAGEAESYTLNGLRDVKPLPNGNYVALTNPNSTSRVLLLEIDAKSGDRKLLWASDFAEDTHPDGLRDKEKLDPKRRCLADDGTPEGRRLTPTPYSMVVDASGTVYLGLNNDPNGTGFGFARVKGGQCELFSYYDFQLADKKGSGFKVPRQPIGAMTLVGKILYAVHGIGTESTLTSLNLESAERKLVSAVSRTPSGRRGKGEVGVGFKGLAVNAEGLYSVNVGDRVGPFGMTRVDLTSGDRTPITAKSGPLKTPLSDDETRVFAIPGSPLLLVSMEHALMVLDPKSGNSSILSF